MTHLEKETFICLDCETTGLDVKKDRVIEVAVAKFTFGGVVEEFETLVDPQCPISEESIKIHHITPDMVDGKPTLEQMMPYILPLVSNHIIIGHGISFDVELLALAADRAGIPHTLRQNRQIDTLRLARRYGESPINSLEQLRRHFNIEAEGAHRAMSDVIVNMEVFKYLTKGYKTTNNLFDALSRPIMMKVWPLGKYKGRLLKELPLDYLLRSAKLDFDQDLQFSIRSELKRRKGGNLFAQAGNPFNNL